MTYPLAVQLYTLRHLSDDVTDLVKVAADVGYTGVEGGYGPDMDAAKIKDALDENNVQMVSAHVSLDALEGDLSSVVAFQKTLHNDTLIIPWISDAHYSDTAASWQKLGARFNKIAQQVKAAGMTLLYHNHSFEFGSYDGKLGLEYLLDSAPDLGLELDLGWCQEGGVDPLPLLKKYSGRASRVHVKDRAPEGENSAQDGWADVGHGVINWEPLLAAAKNAGTEWFVVEHDAPTDPVATIRRSFDYLKTI
ncbi:sugar phosphate isomerase/epimerase [soil metagenome]